MPRGVKGSGKALDETSVEGTTDETVVDAESVEATSETNTDAVVTEPAATPRAPAKKRGESSASFEELQRQVMQLQAALAAQIHTSGATAPADASSAEELVELQLLRGAVITLTVADPRNGLERTLSFDRRDAKATILKSQLAQVQERYPHFFEQGYLGCDAIASGPNTILNMGQFVDQLALEDINSRIQAITSTATLFDLFHFIESKRYTHLDEKGKPLTVKDGDTVLPSIRELAIEHKQMAVLRAVQVRLQELMDVRVSLDP